MGNNRRKYVAIEPFAMELRKRTKVNHSKSLADGTAKYGASYGYETMPILVLEEIFKNLSLEDLKKVSRVCRQWYEAAKSPSLWKHVDARHIWMTSDKLVELIQSFPLYVRHLIIGHPGGYNCSDMLKLNLWEFTMTLKKKCPQLEVLKFQNTTLSLSETKNTKLFYALDHLPQCLSVLSFENSFFISEEWISATNFSSCPKVKVLHVSFSSKIGNKHIIFLASRLSHLKELYLSKCMLISEGIDALKVIIPNLKVLGLNNCAISSRVFSILKKMAHCLVELYVCENDAVDDDLTFKETYFPHLQVICLQRTSVTRFGVEMLLNSCQSLQHVYVSCHIPDEMLNRFCKGRSTTVHSDDTHYSCNKHFDH